MTDLPPQDAVAVSPDDQSSDRAQSDADHVVTVAALEHLAQSTEALTKSADKLSKDARSELVAATAQRRRFMWFMGIMAAVVAIFLAGLYYQTSKSNDVLGGTKAARKAQISLSKEIKDCVEPTGKCYQDGQARTAKAIGSINEASALAAACAPNYVSLPLPQRITAIERCIVAHLSK